jgi:hypothetical protein
VRNLRFQRLLSRCALVAVLLLATLPTLGRLWLPAHPASHSPSHSMSMAHGHAMPAGHDTRDPLPPAHEHAQDCAYCALLSDTVPPTLLAAAISQAPVPAPRPMPIASMPPAAVRGSGLGARGPPRHT